MLYDNNKFNTIPLVVQDYFKKFYPPKGGIKRKDKSKTNMETVLKTGLRELKEETGIESKYEIVDRKFNLYFKAGDSEWL